MVAVRVHRHAVEVLAKTPVRSLVSRQEVEAAFVDDSTGGTVRVHRHSVEALSKTPAIARVSRQEIEGAFEDDSTGGPVRVHRHAVEVIAELPARTQLTRQEIEAAFEDVGSGATVRVHRHAIEVLGRAAVPPPEPLTFPTLLDFFLHNWAETLSLETRYITDVTRSPTSLAEERTALLQRPQRQMNVQFLHAEKAEVDRLFTTLRRMTGETLAMPLYQDAVLLDASTVGTATLNGNFRYRRYFDGGRIAVFPARPESKSVMAASEIDLYLIDSVDPTQITTTTNLSQTYDQGAYIVVPILDLELVLTPGILQLTDDTALVNLTVNEVVGKNALPPSFTGNIPDGWQEQLSLPVLEIEPDWEAGVATSYRRYGQRRTEGRSPVVVPEGTRYVQVQDFNLKLNREDFWRVLQFFDSRRGRMGAFWGIDQEFLWTVTDTDPQFVDVTPFGQFDDFQADFTTHLGIVMNDGTVYIREVNTIQDVLGSWRITIVAGNDLPAIDVSQIKRFSRARTMRFDSDALEERWLTTEVATMGFAIVEVLEEKEVDVG